MGDSLGRVTFYDGKLGALLHSFKIHEADVLCLGVSPNEKQVRILYLKFDSIQGCWANSDNFLGKSLEFIFVIIATFSQILAT